MSKVTLEDAACLLEVSHDCCEGREREAALVRAADAVAKAARAVHGQEFPSGWKNFVPGLLELKQALAAFDKISKGEQS